MVSKSPALLLKFRFDKLEYFFFWRLQFWHFKIWSLPFSGILFSWHRPKLRIKLSTQINTLPCTSFICKTNSSLPSLVPYGTLLLVFHSILSVLCMNFFSPILILPFWVFFPLASIYCRMRTWLDSPGTLLTLGWGSPWAPAISSARRAPTLPGLLLRVATCISGKVIMKL